MADRSKYCQITEAQERLLLTDYYIIGTIGLTVSTMIFYSSINQIKKLKSKQENNNDKYYTYAMYCSIYLAIASLLAYLFQMCFTSLIIPTEEFMTNNLKFVTMIDSIVFTLWLIFKVLFYYGFTFLYLSIFEEQNKIDNYMKFMMVIVFIMTFTYGILMVVDDLQMVSDEEISITEKYGIYVPLGTNCLFGTGSVADGIIIIISGIMILTDFIYVSVLIYRFVSGVKRINNYYTQSIKGIILLCISSGVFIVVIVSYATGSDAKFIFNNISGVADTVCLYLMFQSNVELYNNLCGCFCERVCGKCCFGSKYQQVEATDEEDELL